MILGYFDLGKFQLGDRVITPTGRLATIFDFSIENGITRAVLAYEYGDGQTVELQTKLLVKPTY